MTVNALDHEVLWPIFLGQNQRTEANIGSWLGSILEVEKALAAAQAELNIIPSAAAESIATLTIDQFDIEILASRTKAVGFPIVGIVEQIAELLPDGLGQYAHWGATTQDILDTAQSLQMKASYDELEQNLGAIGRRLAELADMHRGSLMTARSQSQPALPTTFGLRSAGWLSGITRHLERLSQSRPRVLVTQLSGAVGTGASFGPNAEELHHRVAERLGLGVAQVNWHTQRDGLMEAAAVFAGVAASLGKIGLDVALSSQQEIGELFAHQDPGSASSSTMPQKRNPISAQQLIQNARIVRSLLPLIFEAAVTDHDRGTGVWQIEWYALPQIAALSLSATDKARQLLDGLVVDTDRMAANLQKNDRVMAEAAMMALATSEGRQRAHDLVQAALRAQPDATLDKALASAGLNLESADYAPENYLGSTQSQIDSAIAGFESLVSN